MNHNISTRVLATLSCTLLASAGALFPNRGISLEVRLRPRNARAEAPESRYDVSQSLDTI